MSEDNKLFAKPRVRFSQTINAKENSKDLSDKRDKILPSIIDIVPVKTSVKILSLENKLDDLITTSTHYNDDAIQKESVISCNSVHTLPQKENDHFLQDQSIHKTDDKESSTDIHDTINLKANNTERTSCKKSSQEDVPGISSSTFPAAKNNNDHCKILKPKNSTTINISKQSAKNSLDKGKENKNSCKKKLSQLNKDKIVKPLCSKVTTQIKKKTDPTKVNVQKSNVTKHNTKSINKPYTLSIDKQIKKSTSTKNSQKNLNIKSSTINVMPCYKYNKSMIKSKSSPVKKSVVRDIVVPNAKAYVEPGIPKQKQIDLSARRINKSTNARPNITSSEKLLYPEYNSIIYTVNKLDEVKKEKIVTDVEHLPTIYKDLVNGKISSALDFPMNEAIYKNLVDLSIDEKQFPSKIMRSKDPQPRQRDLVPKLSDFFVPESVDEYYTPMFVKSKNSDFIENWNAFRISDKICEWKDSMDN
ncbi:putative serine/threonine-protein kinase [Vespula squamosa]|uniref:Serine/threonine-protein kinase n=1 Tax=Vespula squamosa TaxID=30214 RepID=A0ABD2C5R6_VESSQ